LLEQLYDFRPGNITPEAGTEKINLLTHPDYKDVQFYIDKKIELSKRARKDWKYWKLRDRGLGGGEEGEVGALGNNTECLPLQPPPPPRRRRA
jgi:hypothetical protein